MTVTVEVKEVVDGDDIYYHVFLPEGEVVALSVEVDTTGANFVLFEDGIMRVDFPEGTEFERSEDDTEYYIETVK